MVKEIITVEEREDGSGRVYLPEGKHDPTSFQTGYLDRETGKELNNPKPIYIALRRPGIAERLRQMDRLSQAYMKRQFEEQFLSADEESSDDAMDFDIEDPADASVTESIYQIALSEGVAVETLPEDKEYESDTALGRETDSAETPSPTKPTDEPVRQPENTKAGDEPT